MTAAPRHPFSEGYGAAWFRRNICPWIAGTSEAAAWWLGYARGREDKAKSECPEPWPLSIAEKDESP